MSHVPANAMPHAKSTGDYDEPRRRGWGRLWLIGGLVAATTLAVLGTLRATS